MEGSSVKRLEPRIQTIISYTVSPKSKVSLNYEKKELLLETQLIANILNSCSIYGRVNIEAVIINLSAKKKYIFRNISAFCEECCSARQHRID